MITFTEEIYDNFAIQCAIDSKKYNRDIEMNRLFWLYYEKNGTTFLKGIDISVVHSKFPDNTLVLYYPLITDEKSYYEVDSFKTPLCLIEDFGIDTKSKTNFNLTISKKSNFIFENIH